ncbi:hypothetical protein L207DRAFT_511451 [Hyaloscypha variabilis F]|uniref:Uncharacterized protein n=1 Tax=Hyaloscypha variabilis (strain UAMH 11265 / GT02V1 / F) TaxID=1149755 RepID=A0A2J6RSW8_HYAVF|nr:hypothetical protein L207DRAFT_511451 [Hyaloscypha variabilis F]
MHNAERHPVSPFSHPSENRADPRSVPGSSKIDLLSVSSQSFSESGRTPPKVKFPTPV